MDGQDALKVWSPFGEFGQALQGRVWVRDFRISESYRNVESFSYFHQLKKDYIATLQKIFFFDRY